MGMIALKKNDKYMLELAETAWAIVNSTSGTSDNTGDEVCSKTIESGNCMLEMADTQKSCHEQPAEAEMFEFGNNDATNDENVKPVTSSAVNDDVSTSMPSSIAMQMMYGS